MAQQQMDTKGMTQDKNDGEDLTTILDPAQRADLTLLIANITESMRKLILDTFDATAGLNKDLFGEGMTEEQKIMNSAINPGTVDVAAYDRERKLKEQYLKELSSPKMKMLKTDTLKAFDQWRQDVIQRIGEVVNSKATAQKQVSEDTTKSQPSTRSVIPERKPVPLGIITKIPPAQNAVRLKDLYPPTRSPLTKLSMQHRALILHTVFLLLLSLEHYNALSRTLLLNLTSSLKLSLKTFEEDEAKVAQGLLEAAKELSADEETKKKAEQNKGNRKWKVGIATAAGAAIIGVTGGLAAPLVAAGVGSVLGGLGLGATAAAGYLGTVAGSSMIVGGLFGAYGGRMTGKMMDKYAKEVEDFAFLPVHGNAKTSEDEKEAALQASEHGHKLRITICISGWLTEQDEVVKPWKVMGQGAEVFGLRWELEHLLHLGNAMKAMVTSAAWGMAQKEIIQRTIFADLMGALWPLGLLKVSRIIDNPFSVAMGRAEKAGEVLADALINKAQGERPVTLVGYSLGARVIYVCLKSLAKRRAFNLVENVVLMGAPTPSDANDWRILRSVVSGRLVNVYSQNDYVLGFMYRTNSVQFGVAGLQKVEGVAGIENLDVSEDVSGHLRYRFLVGSILKTVGFEDIDMEAVEEQQQALKKIEEEEKKQSLQAQRDRLLRLKSMGGKADEDADAEQELKSMEKQVESQTQKSLMTRAVEYFYTPNAAKEAQKAVNTTNQAANKPTEATSIGGGAKGEANKKATSTTQSYTNWAASHLPSMSYGSNQGSSPPSVKKPSTSKDAAQNGTYTQKVAEYMPKSLPSLPKLGFGGSKKSTEKGTFAPKLDRKPSGDNKKPPKLDRQPSRVKSPLEGQRTPSGLKSPTLKSVSTSGIKSPTLVSRSSTSEVVKPPLPKRTSTTGQVASSPKPSVTAR